MPRNSDVRWRQRFSSFKKALGRLADAAALAQERELSDLEQQGLIQAFEFTHELAWKTLSDFLRSRGAMEKLYGSKDVTREAFARGLIEEGEEWMAIIESGNQTSHTYNQETADAIADAILSRYVAEFEKLRETLGRLEEETE